MLFVRFGHGLTTCLTRTASIGLTGLATRVLPLSMSVAYQQRNPEATLTNASSGVARYASILSNSLGLICGERVPSKEPRMFSTTFLSNRYKVKATYFPHECPCQDCLNAIAAYRFRRTRA